MSDGRGQIFAMRANLLRRFAGAQECRNAAVAARVEYVARMAIVERIIGCDIDENHRMGPCDPANGLHMTFLKCVLIGGDHHQRIPVANATGVLQQSVDIARFVPITLQRIVQRLFELRKSAIEWHTGDRA